MGTPLRNPWIPGVPLGTPRYPGVPPRYPLGSPWVPLGIPWVPPWVSLGTTTYPLGTLGTPVGTPWVPPQLHVGTHRGTPQGTPWVPPRYAPRYHRTTRYPLGIPSVPQVRLDTQWVWWPGLALRTVRVMDSRITSRGPKLVGMSLGKVFWCPSPGKRNRTVSLLKAPSISKVIPSCFFFPARGRAEG